MQINGSTKVLGIIGDPIAHSFSPAMQNAAILAAGINAVYLPFHVKTVNLKQAVEAIRSLSLTGVNVTVPHKEDVIPFLDEIDPAAKMIGAVNTIVNRDGRLIGYNTDGLGFIRSLQDDLDFQPSGKKVVLLGAGGAARAAIVSLAQSGVAHILIANRTFDKAEQLAGEFSGHFSGVEITSAELDEQSLIEALKKAHLLVNTTVVGLQGESFPFPIVEKLSADAVLYDMVYAPALTPLQQTAKNHAVSFSDGRSMLVGQGEEAFQLWFETKPPAEIMRLQIVK